ncbi:hypothetical protein GCM10027456_32080 [Kineosporia babensis]|uniref:Uncharacterized protein n=1 Tax=Kineosporia babensis TaxID=499548 RepID=A0A9X1SYJ2_9ACTN|nr:hypothetical protein [Kineosporia babensis]MCD5311053.1 hypothetical protein [Kineosporia babensis]
MLRFAEGLLESGMPPRVVLIDDNWACDYGTWQFDRACFPDPAALIGRLHELGCSVIREGLC